MPRNIGLEITIEEHDGIVQVGLSGSVDHSSQPEMKRKIGPYCDVEDVRLLIDFGDTTYLNSSSIGAISDFNRRCQKSHGAMAACRVDSSIQEIFELLGLTKTIKMFRTREEARGYLLNPK